MNIHDIAKLADCSVSTVSRVLNHHPYVSEEKKKRVLAVIKETNYTPNSKARDLSRGSSQTIGVMLPYIHHSYYEKLISGILSAAFQKDYKVILLPTNYQEQKEIGFLEQLAAKAFDGLIITSKKISFEKIEPYTAYGPIVCCEDTGSFPISCIDFEREKSYKAFFQKLKEKGYRKIGFTIGRPEKYSASTAVLLKSYLQIFGELPVDEYLFRDCFNYKDALKAGEYFAQLKELELVFANSDDVAAGLLQTLDSSSVQVVGEENLLASTLLNFSTIDHHLDQCGHQAFHLLFEETGTKRTVPYTFIER